MLAKKWVDTRQGPKGRDVHQAALALLPHACLAESLWTLRVHFLSTPPPPGSAPRDKPPSPKRSSSEPTRASRRISFHGPSLPSTTPGGCKEGSGREPALGRAYGSPKWPQPKTRRALGPGRGLLQRAQAGPERSGRQGDGAALSRATRRALAAGVGGSGGGGVVPWQQVRPKARRQLPARRSWLRKEPVSFSAFA